jgi:uncharacterized protein (TIGR03435 family)
LRSENRRRQREQESYMQSTLTGPGPASWQQIAPLLDEAMGRLREADRNAIILRYFENKTPQEVATTLKLNEVTARKRVSRALGKLRSFFVQRGVTLSAAALAGAVAANSVQAAPAGVVASISAATAKGAVVGGSTLTLVQGALKIMAWTKIKTIVVLGAAVLLAGGATTVVVQKVIPRFHEPVIDESLWQADSRIFKKVPPVLIIRPAQSDGGPGGGARSASLGDDIGRAMLLNTTLSGLLAAAYGVPESSLVLPDPLPAGHFDLMLTLPDHPREALQAELKKRFGLVGHLETRDADALVLTIKNTAAPGLARSQGGRGGSLSSSSSMSSSMKSISVAGTLPPAVAAQLHARNAGSGDQLTMNNQTLADFARYLERRLGQPVSDQTGATNRFDIKLQVQARAGESPPAALKRSLLEQLGLELAPGHAPMQMLVVAKAD